MPNTEKQAQRAAAKTKSPDPLTIGAIDISPGERKTIDLPLPRLYTHTEMSMTVQVLHGPKPGPALLLCAALHGDELNGVEIVRRVVEKINHEELRGSLIAVPIVNVFGFITQSRYLPDRRDLNRSFPGSRTGSLAARLARLFMDEVVRHCTHGIDLHTASLDRTNLPQIRANLEEPAMRGLAASFGAPVFVNSQLRDGSLREAATNLGIRLLIYEGGEAQRFNDDAISMGVNGVLRVMATLKMLKGIQSSRTKTTPREVTSSSWVRARQSGIFHLEVALGQEVRKGQVLGFISDALGENKAIVRAPESGLIIGHQNNPLVHRGDAIVHLATLKDPAASTRNNGTKHTTARRSR